MVKKLFAMTLALVLVMPEALLAAQKGIPRVAAANPPATPAASSPQSSSASQTPQSVRPQSTSQRHSYQREVKPRRRSGISKGEVAFMAGIAGTSMGIGAIAGGGTGLAVGAIIGGWGAYVGHRIWNWVK